MFERILDGSSLRVRGTERRLDGNWFITRVIPACAGNRLGGLLAPTPHSGHPCVCGEQHILPSSAVRSRGSSLRVRGTGCLSWSAIEFSCQIQPLWAWAVHRAGRLRGFGVFANTLGDSSTVASAADATQYAQPNRHSEGNET